MKNTKKILSLALTLAMLLSAVFCTGAVVTAEGTTATLPTTCKMIRLDLSSEKDMDWSILGQNLIPDSNVSEFDSNGNYDTYYVDEINGSGVNNPNAHWGKPTLKYNAYTKGEEKYKGPARRGQIDKDVSHTADRTGSLRITPAATDDSSKLLNMPIGSSMKQDSWYLITFWIKASAAGDVKFHTRNDWSGIYNTIAINATTNWQRVTVLAYCDDQTNHKDRYGAYVCVEEMGTKTVYVDEFEQYKVDLDYAQKCIDAGNKLLNGKEDYLTSDTREVKKVFTYGDYANFDFSTFGENLAYDPTVSKFNADGTYATTNAIKKSSGATDIIKAPNTEGHVSRTDDGSGVVYCEGKSDGQHYIFHIGPTMQKKSYYLVTYFAKTQTNTSNNVNHYYSASGWTNKEFSSSIKSPNAWKRITYIVYTGNSTSDSAIGFYCYTGIWVDDIAIYKLDPEYASNCITSSKLLSEADMRNDADFPAFTAETFTGDAVKDFDFEALSGNLISDSSVKAFNADGTYKTYYASMGTTHDNSTVANPDAWWAVPASFKHVSGKWGGWESWQGVDIKTDRVTNDNQYSHTIGDGSGALKVSANSHLYLPLPTFKAKSYYLLTFWVKNGKNNAMLQLFANGGSKITGQDQTRVTTNTGTDWNRYTFIIKTGTTALAATNALNVYAESQTYVDDIELYEIDAQFAEDSLAANKLVKNKSGTSVEATANSIKTVTAEAGYFVPYGAMYIKDTDTIAEKLGNGRFYVRTEGTYNYTQFKYPTGTVGTFGASAKTDADDAKTGIQFGSLITDNLNVDKNGTGTLVFRGDFEKFRKTFPTKTRAEVLNAIYKALKKANVTDGAAVKLNNGGESVVVMNVPRKTYMWKNSANTELQYAVRVTNVVGNAYESVNFTAVGYVTKGGNVEFSNEIKTANYAELISAQN